MTVGFQKLAGALADKRVIIGQQDLDGLHTASHSPSTRLLPAALLYQSIFVKMARLLYHQTRLSTNKEACLSELRARWARILGSLYVFWRSGAHGIGVAWTGDTASFVASTSPGIKWLVRTMTDQPRHDTMYLTMKTKADTAKDKEKETRR